MELHFTFGYKSEAFAHLCGPQLDVKTKKLEGRGQCLGIGVIWGFVLRLLTFFISQNKTINRIVKNGNLNVLTTSWRGCPDESIICLLHLEHCSVSQRIRLTLKPWGCSGGCSGLYLAPAHSCSANMGLKEVVPSESDNKEDNSYTCWDPCVPCPVLCISLSLSVVIFTIISEVVMPLLGHSHRNQSLVGSQGVSSRSQS